VLDGTPSELFRMVTALCRRGYIVQQEDDRYSLTSSSSSLPTVTNRSSR
jgi:DNA-binding IclR family transcriptional regulator